MLGAVDEVRTETGAVRPPYASIAEELGISLPYVHTMRYRALKELRGLIDL